MVARWFVSGVIWVAAAVALVAGLSACSSKAEPSDTLDGAGRDACELAVTLTTSGMTDVNDIRTMREEVEENVAASGYTRFGADPFITDILRVCADEGYPVEVR